MEGSEGDSAEGSGGHSEEGSRGGDRAECVRGDRAEGNGGGDNVTVRKETAEVTRVAGENEEEAKKRERVLFIGTQFSNL